MIRKKARKVLPLFVLFLFSFFLLWMWNFLIKKEEVSPLSRSFEIMHQMKKNGAPSFILPDLFSSMKVSLDEFQSEVFLIHFWASWCEPCLKEFPSLLKLSERFKHSISVFAISIDKNREEAKVFIRPFQGENTSGVFKILWDKAAEVAFRYGSQSVPETYILNLKKKLIRKVIGIQDWNSPDSISYFNTLVGNGGQSSKANKISALNRQ